MLYIATMIDVVVNLSHLLYILKLFYGNGVNGKLKTTGWFKLDIASLGTFCLYIASLGTFCLYIASLGTFCLYIASLGTFCLYIASRDHAPM